MALRRQNGFSLLELAIALSLSMILCAVTVFAFQPVLKAQHVASAYNTTLMALRKAHDAAAADMRIYVVTFTPAVPNVNGGTITVTQDIVTPPTLFTAILPRRRHLSRGAGHTEFARNRAYHARWLWLWR